MRSIQVEGRAWTARLLPALILLLSGCGSTGSSSDKEATPEEGPTTVLEATSAKETIEATTEISEGATAPKQDDQDNRGMSKAVVTVAGVLEKPNNTTYRYGPHAITDEISGASYALRSEHEGLLDGYMGQRVTVYGTVGTRLRERPDRGWAPLLNVIRIESASSG